MNLPSWTNDELGQLIRCALHETVGDSQPSPHAWLNIKRRLHDQDDIVTEPQWWLQLAVPSLRTPLVVVLLLVLISTTLSWEITIQGEDSLAIEPTIQETSSELAAVIHIDHPSEPSPIITRAKDMAARRALASAVDRGVFAGTLRRESSAPARQLDTGAARTFSLTRARD